MGYDHFGDRDNELDEAEMYEDISPYEGADTFGEQIGETGEDKAEFEDNEAAQEHVSSASEQSSVEDAFGETLNQEQNPHLADQMDDTKLGQEADADYSKTETEE